MVQIALDALTPKQLLTTLEPLVPIAISIHGGLLLAYFGGELWQWCVVGSIALAGLLGLVEKLNHPYAARIRCIYLIAATWLLMLFSSGPDSHFGLWYFAIVAFYPLLVGARHGVVVPLIVAMAYLSLAILAPNNIPVIVVLSQVFLLFCIGLLGYLIGRYLRKYPELQMQAQNDGLTNCYNHNHFFQQGELEVKRAQRLGMPLSVLLLDGDDFKHINDTYGHAVGDDVLKTLAERLRQNTRSIDSLGRIGGDEFSVLLPNASLSDAQRLADRLKRSIEEIPVTGAWGELNFSVSIGAAELNEETDDFSTLLEHADASMYQKKKLGKAGLSLVSVVNNVH